MMGVCKCRKLQPLLGINYLQSYQLISWTANALGLSKNY